MYEIPRGSVFRPKGYSFCCIERYIIVISLSENLISDTLSFYRMACLLAFRLDFYGSFTMVVFCLVAFLLCLWYDMHIKTF